MTLSDKFMHDYGVSEIITKTVDFMQQTFMCCGALRFEEYHSSVWFRSVRPDLINKPETRLVPDSCCTSMKNYCGSSDHPSNISYMVSLLHFLNYNFYNV